MTKRRHFTVYWNEQDEGALMTHLENIARFEKRSKSSTMLVALRQYIAQYLENSDSSVDSSLTDSQGPAGEA